MKKLSSIVVPSILAFLGFVATVPTYAVPYASGITTNGGSIYFYLNENVTNAAAGDDVKVIFDGGGAGNTNDLGALSKGQQSFALGAHTTWEIQVTKNAALGWTKISDDSNKYNQYFSPGGIAINRNPSSLSLFGRIYVAENVGGTSTTFGTRTDQDGIYILNPDFSDALGHDDTASTGGIGTFVTGNTTDGQKSPWRLYVGDDDYLYVADYSTNNGTVFRMNPDVTVGEPVLSGTGNANWTSSVHTTCNSSPFVKGTLTGGNLQLWTIDGEWPSGGFNRLVRYDINSGPLPWNSAPNAVLRTAGVPSVADVQADLDIAPDGKFFLCQNRSAGTANTYDADRVNVRVLDTDGTTVLWDSLSNSLAIGQQFDVFVNARAIAVTPDNKKMALAINNTHVWIVDLTNGVPDITTRYDLNAFAFSSTSTANRREVAFDAAGNLYSGNNSRESVAVWSPGGSTTAITRSSGTFNIVVPPSIVTIAATVATTTEGSGTPAVLTLTRTGSTTGTLTVNYSASGTAVSGVNYTALPGTITFAGGQSTTNLQIFSINDGQSGPSTTVTIAVTTGNGYGTGTPGSATATILDVGTPTINITAVQPLMAECATGSKATFQLQRLGSLATTNTVNLSYSGVAVVGTDFNGASSITFATNDVTTNLVLTPILTTTVNPAKNYTVTVATGSGYTPGATNSASGTIYSANLAPATVLFSDSFDTDTSANWQVSMSGTSDAEAIFNYDYSLINGLPSGIPEAPSSTGGSAVKRGLRLRAHLLSTADTPGISASPLNLNLTGDYRLRFDFWMNYNGPLDVGGAGSSQHANFGVGVTPGYAVLPSTIGGVSTEGIWFATTTDGDVSETSTSQADFCAFIGSVLQSAGLGYYSAGLDTTNRGNFDPYYALWGDVAAPAAQLTSYPSQSTKVRAGALGMAWHCVTINKQGDNVTWDVDGRRIATVPLNLASMSGNIFLGFYDWFSSACGTPNLMFALFDNVRVESLPPPQPVISAIHVAGGQVSIDFTGTSSDSSSSFTLLGSSVLSTSASAYTPVSGSAINGSSGTFQATAPVGGSTMFYRIQR